MMQTKSFLWLALAVVLLCTTGCPVDVNEGSGEGDDDGGSTAECEATDLATVRFFHAAGGTPVTRPDEFTPPTTRNLNVVREDKDNAVVTSLAPGRASLVQLCASKSNMLNLRLAGAKENRLALSFTFTPPLTPDADAKLFDAGRTVVLAGIADSIVDGAPENPKSAANPLRFIDVPDVFTTGAETQIQVVHASRKVASPVSVELNPDAMMAEIATLDRYTASTIYGTKGTTDVAPSAVPVVFEDTATTPSTKTSFSISPRIPMGAKALAILFDTEVFDPKNPDPTKVNPATTARLFVTGDDPLLGRVVGGGVQF